MEMLWLRRRGCLTGLMMMMHRWGAEVFFYLIDYEICCRSLTTANGFSFLFF